MLGTSIVFSKCYNDVYYSNESIAQACNLHRQEVHQLEKQVLQALDFNVFIKEDEFGRFLVGLANFLQPTNEPP